jgi:hypothetical protein
MSKFAKLAGAGALASLAAMLAIATPGSAQTAVRGGPVKGPPPERAASPYQAYRTAGSAMADTSDAGLAAIYDALPTGVSGAVNPGIAKLKPADAEFVNRARGGQACTLAEFRGLCAYYGAEAVNKTIAYSWSQPQSIMVGGTGGAAIQNRIPKPGPCDGATDYDKCVEGYLNRTAGPKAPDVSVQLALLDHGFRKKMAQAGGDRGFTDEQLRQSGIVPGAANAKAAGIQINTNFWGPGCASDQKALGGWWYVFQQHRLTSCGMGLGQRAALVIFGKEVASAEWGILLSHSHFMRKVGLWIPEATEPQICANSIVHTSSNNKCNSYDWISPISATFGFALNNGPVNVDTQGSATRMATGFNTLIDFQ